jgi:hypothetical protein
MSSKAPPVSSMACARRVSDRFMYKRVDSSKLGFRTKTNKNKTKKQAIVLSLHSSVHVTDMVNEKLDMVNEKISGALPSSLLTSHAYSSICEYVVLKRH